MSAVHPGWLLNELATAGRENLDPAHADRYDDLEDAQAADEIAYLREHGLRHDMVVLDLGAGTGQFTLAAADHCSRVFAVDVSPIMLERLQAKVAEGGPGNVAIIQAGFLTYQRTAEPVDLVYTRYALHHLPDAWKAIALHRIRRITKPGGLLRLWDVAYHFTPDQAQERFETWCSTAGDGTGGQWSRADLEEHLRDEHSTFTWLLEPMITNAGYRIEDATYADDGIFARYLARHLNPHEHAEVTINVKDYKSPTEENIVLSNRSMPDVSVVPVLVYDDVTEAREWLCRVFGFTERWHVGDHRAQLSFGSGAVVVRDNSGDDEPPARCSIMVRVEDVDAHCEHARSLGATIASPPTDHKYGERQYSVEDPGGHRWMFTQTLADVAPEEWGARSNVL